MERKNTLLLTVIAVATLLVAVVGATFAYFASTYTQNGENQVVNVTTRQVASVTYNAGSVLAADTNVNLASGAGDHTLTSNVFNVALTGDSTSTATVNYKIMFNVTTNTFVEDEHAGENAVTCKVYVSDDGATWGTAVATKDCTQTGAAASSTVELYADTQTFSAAGSTKYYKVEVVLYNSAAVDNTNANKSLQGTLSVTGLAAGQATT